MELELPFSSAHNLRNTLAAVAAARAVGVRPRGRVDVRFSALRGERVELPDGAVVINDCYNANPLSMRAALDDLAMQEPARRRLAVLGDMLELGADEREHHREIGAYAAERAGRRAGHRRPARGGDGRPLRRRGPRGRPTPRRPRGSPSDLVEPGDVVLVKGSRGVGLEVVAEALGAGGTRRRWVRY